ncbi:unnamed protein product [Phytophthora fragariaefolia]|uniref:Unnamed protein product n=1 Tax=Phytophthora fragariaefolia TaxID=1490495 RepID=A0A9W6XRT4_9STRA|nr:unnamed protein product [Phytophthora fragariaefolia]
MVMKVSTKRIFCYNPLNQKPYMRTANDVATHLKYNGLNDYDAVPLKNPIQFDQCSCELFVCWILMHQVVYGLTPDLSYNFLAQRRFELFYYILTGRLMAPKKNAAGDVFVQIQLPPREG